MHSHLGSRTQLISLPVTYSNNPCRQQYIYIYIYRSLIFVPVNKFEFDMALPLSLRYAFGHH